MPTAVLPRSRLPWGVDSERVAGDEIPVPSLQDDSRPAAEAVDDEPANGREPPALITSPLLLAAAVIVSPTTGAPAKSGSVVPSMTTASVIVGSAEAGWIVYFFVGRVVEVDEIVSVPALGPVDRLAQRAVAGGCAHAVVGVLLVDCERVRIRATSRAVQAAYRRVVEDDLPVSAHRREQAGGEGVVVRHPGRMVPGPFSSLSRSWTIRPLEAARFVAPDQNATTRPPSLSETP